MASHGYSGSSAQPQWISTLAEEVGMQQAWDGFSQPAWEDWMRWDQPTETKSPKPSDSMETLVWKPDQKMSAARNSTTNQQQSQATGALPVLGTSELPLSMNDAPAYTFGQPNEATPAFGFDNSAMTSVPATGAGQVATYVAEDDAWNCNDQLTGSDTGVFSPHDNGHQSLSPFEHAHAVSQSQSSATTSAHQSSNGSPRNATDSSHSSPEPAQTSKRKKRKASSDEELSSGKETTQPQVKKTAHNMIEKRYRTNLNDKIAALRDSVPSLRVMSRLNGSADDDDAEDLEGLTPAHKLNKATVLSKATEYIQHLEKRNQRLVDELASVKARLQAAERQAAAATRPMSNPVPTRDGIRVQDDPFSAPHVQPQTVTLGGPQGMIPVPENMMNLRAAQSQQQFPTAQTSFPLYNAAARQPAYDQPTWIPRGGSVMSKLMVGSLAALMIVEGYSEREKSGEQPEGRGLFALPMHLLGRFGAASTHSVYGVEMNLLPLMKAALVFGAFVYLIAPLFEHRRKSKTQAASSLKLSPAPSLASPVEVRRQAWLTAIQTVWVPRHSFFLEAAALSLKTIKLSARKLIGWHGYALLTGITKEQEAARVKAWDIALSAQLTGGDAEISISRLVLTLMASGTLPDTPARLMLKSMHVRVLLWEVANAGYGAWYMFEEISAKLARVYWNAAREQHKMLQNDSSRSSDDEEPLPDHLAALIEMECDDVLVKDVVQRAYNLAWNRPSPENASNDQPMDSVVEDFRISSPLDALAAWWSSYTLSKFLVQHLGSPDTKSNVGTRDGLALALRTAPPSSRTNTRVLAARALLVPEDRAANIAVACDALPCATNHGSPSGEPNSPQSLLMNAIDDGPVATDVRMVLTFAKCLSLAQKDAVADEARARIASVISNHRISACNLSLLGFAGAYEILDAFTQDDALLGLTKAGLERLVGAMRIWVGTEDGRRSGLHGRTRAKLVERCLSFSKMLVGMRDMKRQEADEDDEEDDAGYVSQSDDERETAPTKLVDVLRR